MQATAQMKELFDSLNVLTSEGRSDEEIISACIVGNRVASQMGKPSANKTDAKRSEPAPVASNEQLEKAIKRAVAPINERRSGGRFENQQKMIHAQKGLRVR